MHLNTQSLNVSNIIPEVDLISLDRRRTRVGHRAPRINRLLKSKYFWGGIGICMIMSLIVVGIIIKVVLPEPRKNGTQPIESSGEYENL